MEPCDYNSVIVDRSKGDANVGLNENDVKKIAEHLERKEAKEVLEWAAETFYPKIALASSFGTEDVVLIDMLQEINPDIKIFTLDTGRLHQETYDLIDEVRRKYNIKIEVYYPDAASAQKMVREHGTNLFYTSPELRKLCCQIRKIEPLKRALKGLDAWITGLRRAQNVSRTDIQKVEVDHFNDGIIKINPLVDWTNDRVWDYIKAEKLPHNKLHDKCFPSIGCEPCTRPIKPGEHLRAGRWWWEIDLGKECGLHPPPK
jgi:phosphoadenosine phosphosulfate reductase